MNLLLALLLPFVTTLPVDPAGRQTTAPLIRAELLVIRLPQSRAISVQKAFKERAGAQKAYDRLIDLAEKNEAELVDWPVIDTFVGMRAVAENIQEIRYAIEFDPPQVVPNGFVPTEHMLVAMPWIHQGAAGPEQKNNGVPYLIGGSPTNFETRNVGVTLELEATLLPDGKISVQIAAQHVELLGFRKNKFEAAGRYTVVAEQPEFSTHKTATNIPLQSGVPKLLSSRKLPKPAGTMELMVFTATVVDAGNPGAQAAPAATPPTTPSPAPSTPPGL